MPDQWTLVTPYGDLPLNATFSAPKYQAGGIDPAASMRRDQRGRMQRSGDGLATPGPLVLEGVIWRDDQDTFAIVDELNDIRDAVAACNQVIRTTTAGAYAYGGLAGGPPPEVAPDGLGGWNVRIELWPERATSTLVPIIENIANVSPQWDHGIVNTRTIVNPGTQENDYILLFLALGANIVTKTPPPGFVEVDSLQTVAGNGPGLYIWQKFASATEPASWTVNLSGRTQVLLCAAIYRGVDLDSPLVDTNSIIEPSLNRNRLLPSINGVVGGRLIGAYTAHGGGGAGGLPVWGAWRHPLTALIDAGSRQMSNSDTHLGVSHRAIISSGSTSPHLAMYNTDRWGVGWVGALRPA